MENKGKNQLTKSTQRVSVSKQGIKKTSTATISKTTIKKTKDVKPVVKSVNKKAEVTQKTSTKLKVPTVKSSVKNVNKINNKISNSRVINPTNTNITPPVQRTITPKQPSIISSSNHNNQNIKYKIKSKKKKINFYFYGNIFLTIILIILLICIFKSCNKKDVEKLDNNSHKEYKEEENVKLKELNYINEKVSFFNMDYIDRYLEYKRNNKDLDDEKVILYVNIGLDNEYYTNVKESPNKYTNTVLVNKYHYLGDDYKPKNLTKIDNSYSTDTKYMEKDAALAFNQLAKDAKKEGYYIIADSTYRSYNYQSGLYNRYKKADGEEKADTYSARAGYSEHQTGLAVDVKNDKKSYTKFGETKEFEWMQENAYKYGFILRYTEENEFITGYISEPWHYRYVGKEIAEYIHNHPMTYEEYYVRFLEK